MKNPACTLVWLIAFALTLSNAVAQPTLSPTHGPVGGTVTWMATQNNTLFAGMWPGGLYRTTDEGLNWEHMKLPGDEYGNVITVFADSQNVFAATWTGLFQSSDGGNTWHKRSPKYVTAVAALPTGYIAVQSGDTVAISDASGQNWTNVYIFPGQPTLGPNRNGILVDGDTVYLGSQARGIYKSYDGGHTWVERNNGFVPGSTRAMIRKGNRIYVGSNTGVYYTDDLAENWTLMSLDGLGLCLDVQCIFSYNDSLLANHVVPVVYTPGVNKWLPSKAFITHGNCYAELNGHLFCGSYDGVDMMTDDFNHWERRSNGMTGAHAYLISVNQEKLWATKWGTSYQSPDSGYTWINPAPYSEMAFNSGVIDYWGDTLLAFGGLYNMYNLYITADTFKTYTHLTDSQTMMVTFASYLKNQDRFLVFTSDTPEFGYLYGHLYYSDNWGGNWQPATGLPMAFPPLKILEAGADLYIIFDYPFEAGVYKSADNGANWSKVNNFPVSTFDFTSWAYIGSTVYVSTFQDGVYYSSDGGGTWQNIAPPSANQFLVAVAGVNGDVYTVGDFNLYRLNRTTNLWDVVATSPEANLRLGYLFVQGNRLLIPTAWGPMCYYDVPAVTTGITESLKILGTNIYPNPTSGTPVQWQLGDEMIGADLQVFDATGKLVYQKQVTANLTGIPVTGLATGSYLARVSNSKTQLSKSFVVK